MWFSEAVTRAWKCYKYIVHMITGQCELERICTGNKSSHEIITKLAKSFKDSSQLCHLKLPKEISDFDSDTFVDSIIAIKRISPDAQNKTVAHIYQWVEREKEIQGMLQDLTKRASEAYASTNERHENTLERLWNLLRPNKKRTGRITKEWQDIGFQGSDPQTDFRAMGMLGLENMVYFASSYPEDAIGIVEKEVYAYPFAIGGISITKNLLDLCRRGDFDVYFYRHGASVEQFHELYSLATIEFVKYYEAEKPPNIMQFESIMKKFVLRIPYLVQ